MTRVLGSIGYSSSNVRGAFGVTRRGSGQDGSVRTLAGRYRLLARLGRGGFGEVWCAEDTLLDRKVAVKTVIVADDEVARRFVREALALARLDHPNVVAVYDTGTDDGLGYVVMQLLTGPSLATQLAQQGPLQLPQVLELGSQAAAGLAAAHEAGIVHRDVSPSNLILDGAGALKLVDFGVARLEDASTELTATGTVFATAGYVSPEQAEGRPADARSDLYSLGCVLYALIEGAPPFTAEHPLGVIQQHLSSPPPALSASVPRQLEELLASMLAKDPRDRPSSAEQVRQRLDEIRAPGVETVPLATVRTRRVRPSRMIGALGLLLLVAGGVLAATLPGSGRPHTAPPPSRSTTTIRATTPPAPSTPEQALVAVRTAVASAQSGGQLDPNAAADLGRHLDDIAKALTHPNPNDAAHKIGDLQHRLGDLVQRGQLTDAGLSAVAAPLNQLAALLPTNDGGGDENG